MAIKMDQTKSLTLEDKKKIILLYNKTSILLGELFKENHIKYNINRIERKIYIHETYLTSVEMLALHYSKGDIKRLNRTDLKIYKDVLSLRETISFKQFEFMNDYIIRRSKDIDNILKENNMKLRIKELSEYYEYIVKGYSQTQPEIDSDLVR